METFVLNFQALYQKKIVIQKSFYFKINNISNLCIKKKDTISK